MKSLSLKSYSDARLVRHISLAGARCQLLVAKTASMLWANLVLKWRDSVLTKVKDSICFESFMDLCNAKLSGFTELFLFEVLEKAVEKSSRVLPDVAIRKAASADKPQQKSAKMLHFSQPSPKQQQQQQQIKR